MKTLEKSDVKGC